MKQTKQYGLNQWELSDPIRMADFNADNSRLEEALKGKAGRFQKIREYVASQGSASAGVTFGVSDWSEWDCVAATFDLQKTSFRDGDFFILYAMDTSYQVDQTTFRGLNGGSFCVLLFPHHDKASRIRGFAAGSGSAPIFLRRPFEDLTGLSILVRNKTLGTVGDLSDTTFNDAIWSVYGMK